MHKLMELKEMLCQELEEYGSKDKLDVGGLEIVDKLAHAIKNIDKILEAYEEEEYSGRRSYEGGRGSYEGGRGSYESGRGSYARRRDSRGRYSRDGGYSREYSNERYSRGGDEMVENLRQLMQDAPDQQTRQEFQRLIQKIEQM